MPAEPVTPTVTLRPLDQHTLVLTLTGEHDLATAPRVRECIERSWKYARLIIDLTPCAFLDSTIIVTLLAARGEGRHVSLVVAESGGVVDRILIVAGVKEVFDTTYGTLGEVLATIAAPAEIEPVGGLDD